MLCIIIFTRKSVKDGKVTHLFDVAKFSEKNSRKKIALKAPLLSTGNCKISDLSKKDNFREFKIEFFSRPTVRN